MGWVRLPGYLIVTQLEDWMFVLEVCNRTDFNDTNAKEAASALSQEASPLLKFCPHDSSLTFLFYLYGQTCRSNSPVECGKGEHISFPIPASTIHEYGHRSFTALSHHALQLQRKLRDPMRNEEVSQSH
jgi:hypothetical protein